MQPDHATVLFQATLPSFESEVPTTRKVIAAIPEDQKEYRPHEKNMTAVELAWHLVSSEVWFLNGIADLNFAMEGDGKLPAEIQTIAQILAWYDENLPKVLARIRDLSGEHLITPVDFFGAFKYPAVTYLSFCKDHTVHHRGQLSAYLRPMGAKVPSIYGGSADEPFQVAAAQ